MGGHEAAQSNAEMDEVADRTAVIASRLKDIYAKSVHPVEKRYQYDYFFESPFMTDVEFDGMWTVEMGYYRCFVSFCCHFVDGRLTLVLCFDLCVCVCVDDDNIT